MNGDILKVIKIGGNVVDSREGLADFLRDYAAIPGPKVLVHGGGKIATRTAAELGVETCMINGRRVTSPAMLDVAVMVYAGLVNKRIVAQLQSLGVNAIGLCGADAGCITSVRRPAVPVDYGEVGDVTAVNAGALMSLITAGMTPVICAITADTAGNLLNTNADTVATETAKALSALAPVELIFCFEKNGVLADVDDPDSVIGKITAADADTLIGNGIIRGGMLPKVENALRALNESAIQSVVIKSSRHLGNYTGTRVTK